MASTKASTGSRAHHPMVSAPLRQSERAAEQPEFLKGFFSQMALSMPNLKKELAIAGMQYTPVQFARQCAYSAAMLAVILEIVTILAMSSAGESFDISLLYQVIIVSVALPIYFYFSLQFFLYQPRVKIKAIGRKIDQEVVFAGRHLLIELRGGMTLFDAMLGVSRDYGQVSVEFNKVVEKITLGVPATAAIHEVAENSPSPYLKRILLQIANSLASGSDVAESLEVVLDQISKEQIIELKAYGQKLNPIVMFYMLFGVIIPSLGVAFMIILLSFVGSGMQTYGVGILLSVLGIVSIIQFLFLSVVENSRPSFDLA